MNGNVSMLLKILNVGSKCQHEGRWRESTINHSLESCPLWLLYKCHKGWTWKKATPPPTRGVMGGNQGMNSHMSEVLSWALEPLAEALLPKSSEVISNEDLKSKLDSVNRKNGSWIPDVKLDGNLGDVRSMMEAEMEMPGWCQCEECEAEVQECETGRVDELVPGHGGVPGPTHAALGGQEICVSGEGVYSVEGVNNNQPDNINLSSVVTVVPGPTQSDQLSGQECYPIPSDQLSISYK